MLFGSLPIQTGMCGMCPEQADTAPHPLSHTLTATVFSLTHRYIYTPPLLIFLSVCYTHQHTERAPANLHTHTHTHTPTHTHTHTRTQTHTHKNTHSPTLSLSVS